MSETHAALNVGSKLEVIEISRCIESTYHRCEAVLFLSLMRSQKSPSPTFAQTPKQYKFVNAVLNAGRWRLQNVSTSSPFTAVPAPNAEKIITCQLQQPSTECASGSGFPGPRDRCAGS